MAIFKLKMNGDDKLSIELHLGSSFCKICPSFKSFILVNVQKAKSIVPCSSFCISKRPLPFLHSFNISNCSIRLFNSFGVIEISMSGPGQDL